MEVTTEVYIKWYRNRRN